jgi:hypothetical protein
MNMITTRTLLGGLVLGAVLMGPAALLPKASAADLRVIFVFDMENRYIRDLGNGTWAEYRNGKLARMHRENGRTEQFVELFTNDPQPTLTRLTNRGVFWRLPTDRDWRQGSSGGWRDPNRFWP